MKCSIIFLKTLVILLSRILKTGFTGAQQCGDIGSVTFSEGFVVERSTTYILPGYRIPCDGFVVGWEFCVDVSLATAQLTTFYPGIWRMVDGGNYRLIHTSSVSFMSQQALSGLTFTCAGYPLPVDEELLVLTNDTVGFYSGNDTVQLLTTAVSSNLITYSLTGNHSNISTADNGVMLEHFNVAIVAQISSIQATSSSSMTMGTSTVPLIVTSTTIIAATPSSSAKTFANITSTTTETTTIRNNIISTTAVTISTATSASEHIVSNTSTPTMMMGTSTSDSTNIVVIGVTVGVITIVLVAIITIVCVIVVHKRKRKLSISYPVTHPTSAIGIVNESFFDKSEVPQGTAEAPRYINYPMHEDATELNQSDSSSDYDTIEIFQYAKNNTNNDCKRTSQYYSMIDDYVNSTDDVMMHDRSMTDSCTALIQPKPVDSASTYYNINNSVDTEQHVVNESDEPKFVDPGVEEGNIYSWLRSKSISTFRPYEIKMYNVLGSGQYGTVKLGTLSRHNDTKNPVQVAVKTLNSQCSESDRVKFLREAAIMGQFVHNNVVQLHGVVTEEENMMIVLEYMPKGDLLRFLYKMQSKISPDIAHELLSFCRQIAAGLDYLSKKHFVHRDLAARNILLSDDFVCKIADFGMARDVTDDNYYMTSKGKIPVKWTAPEALFFQRYSIHSDAWSYGCVLYEIWSIGHKPFEKFDTTQYLEKIMEGYRLSPPPGCSRAIYDIMIQCWHYEPKARITSEAVVRMLSKSDRVLLQWSDEDKPNVAEAALLGEPLHLGEQLYKDLRTVYLNAGINHQ